MLEDAETGFTNAPEEEEHDERSDANARREACRAVIAQIVSKAACIKVCFGKKRERELRFEAIFGTRIERRRRRRRRRNFFI